jgi:hypothetical protein
MRTLNGWIGGLGGSAALTTGVIVAALTATGYVAFRGGGGLDLPAHLGPISVGHGGTESVPVEPAPRPQPISVGHVTVRPAAGLRSHAPGRRGGGPVRHKQRRVGATPPAPQSPGNGGGHQPPRAPSQPVGSQPTPAPAPGGGSGGGGGTGGHPLGDTVRSTTQQLGNTLTGTSQTLGNTVGAVSPPLGQTVDATGQLLGGTVTGAGQTVGNTLDTLLGAH